MPQSVDVKNEKKVSHLAGHSLFNDVEDEQMRAFNRCVTMVNLKEEGSEALSKEYFTLITPADHVSMVLMAGYIKAKGFEETLKEIKA